MKIVNFLLIMILCVFQSFSQPLRIAILDFDNISGITKYDGLGKAMSSMLISDIESNVSSKRLQLVERAQINKIMKEQNLQKSASFDKNTSVKMGKLLGVNFILVGDIYILDNILVINARLTNVSTGDIKFSEKQEGKVNEWLTIKTKLGKGVTSNLSMPFTEPRIPDAIVAPAVLTTYASAIDENDKGNFEKAETLISTAKEFNPDFGYLDDLRDEVEKLKKKVAEQGKKIEVLEKSGGRVVNAKTYDELKNNFTNDLTNYEEKKQIFVSIINRYSLEWDKDKSMFYNLFSKKYDISNLGLSDCNSLLIDMLKLRGLVDKDKLNDFDKNMYYLLGFSMQFAQKRIGFDHDFSEIEYTDFKNLMNNIISNTFYEKSEQLFAQFNFLSFFKFRNDNKNFKQFVKKDIIKSHKDVYFLLNYPYANQIIQRCESDKSELSEGQNWKALGLNSILNASEEIICFLSGKRNDFKNIISIITSFNINLKFEDAFEYYFKNNAQNELSIRIYVERLNKTCQFFTVPSMGSTNLYQKNSSYQNQFLSEIPEFIPMNKDARNTILSLDSISRRYSRISQIIDANKISDPCYISQHKDFFINTSDSLALISDAYILNDNWPIGSKITMIFNNGKDTTIAYIVAKKSTNTTKEFEVIENAKSNKINKNYTVLFQTERNGFTFYDLVPNNNENSRRELFYNYILACSRNQNYEREKKEGDAFNKKQQEIQKQQELQRNNAFREKFNKTTEIFNKSSVFVDTMLYKRIIKQVEGNDISIDSLFTLGFNLLLPNENYIFVKGKSNNELDVRISLLLNIYFINSLEQQNDNRKIVRDFINAATINLAHGYMLISIKNNLNAFDFASSEYKKVSSSYKFDESFNSLIRDQMILADWNDFIEKGLVTKSQLTDFNNKFKIISNF